MKVQRSMSRWSLARRLQDVALRISAGKPIRVGGVSVCIPDRVVFEQEVETRKGKTELEFELKWPVTAARSARKPSNASSRRGKGGSTY
jgi:amphi-Trp domain-containing protein